jgi:hypothetical protein
VVSFNIAYAIEIDRAIEALKRSATTPERRHHCAAGDGRARH